MYIVVWCRLFAHSRNLDAHITYNDDVIITGSTEGKIWRSKKFQPGKRQFAENRNRVNKQRYLVPSSDQVNSISAKFEAVATLILDSVRTVKLRNQLTALHCTGKLPRLIVCVHNYRDASAAIHLLVIQIEVSLLGVILSLLCYCYLLEIGKVVHTQTHT
jgi:hypothetical protein